MQGLQNIVERTVNCASYNTFIIITQLTLMKVKSLFALVNLLYTHNSLLQAKILMHLSLYIVSYDSHRTYIF